MRRTTMITLTLVRESSTRTMVRLRTISLIIYSLDNSALSDEVYKNVRVFCWIMSKKNNTYTKAIHVNATWAPRCNGYAFVTAEKVLIAMD